MKMYLRNFLLSALTFSLAATMLSAQETPEITSDLPGDNFSLEGAVELFKTAATLEDFEKALNATDSEVNNLDLNEDGETDYIRVIDRAEGKAHAVVLQAVLNEKESQDVAVIEIEKDGDESAILQIVGDEDLYGSQVITEPFEEEVKKTNGRGGPSVHGAVPFRIVVNVWFWPSVRFIYGPAYVPYYSPWRWRYYPVWYRPYRHRPYHVFYGYHRPYHVHYHVVTVCRVNNAHNAYHPHRSYSPAVHTRTQTVVERRGKDGGHNGRDAQRGNVDSRDNNRRSDDGRNGRETRKDDNGRNDRQQDARRSDDRNGRDARKDDNGRNDRQQDARRSDDRGGREARKDDNGRNERQQDARRSDDRGGREARKGDSGRNERQQDARRSDDRSNREARKGNNGGSRKQPEARKGNGGGSQKSKSGGGNAGGKQGRGGRG